MEFDTTAACACVTCPLLSLPPELLIVVVERLIKKQWLANFAAASPLCLAAAQGGLRAALLEAVTRSTWLPGSGRISDALVACPYFCLPDHLVAVPAGAFSRCTGLSSELILPDAITKIGNFAFRGCSALTDLRLPAAVTSVGDFAFRDCCALTKFTLPASLTSIGKAALKGCISLKQILFPAGLTYIGSYAFQGCSSLKKLTLPASVTIIYPYTFHGLHALSEVHLPSALTTIGDFAFSDCDAITSIILPTALQVIGPGAFRGCTRLTMSIFPVALTYIGSNAFHGTSLTELSLPATLTFIGHHQQKRFRWLHLPPPPLNDPPFQHLDHPRRWCLVRSVFHRILPRN